MVSVSGYLIGSQESGKMPLPPKAELEWWYQYYFATERGRPVGPAKLMKQSFSQNRKASPKLGCRALSGGTPWRLSGLDKLFMTF